MKVSKYIGVSCFIFLKNQTPLHLTKNIEIAEILIQSGADVNSRDIIVSMCYVVSKETIILNSCKFNLRHSNYKSRKYAYN